MPNVWRSEWGGDALLDASALAVPLHELLNAPHAHRLLKPIEEEGAVLVAAAVMALSMLAVSAPVFAVPEGCPGGELQPGQSGEKARAPQTVPSETQPGDTRRSPTADEHDPTDNLTGRGQNCAGQI